VELVAWTWDLSKPDLGQYGQMILTKTLVKLIRTGVKQMLFAKKYLM
jgi:hypothetical protein